MAATQPRAAVEAKHSWEEAIEILRRDPAHQKLVYDAYLTADLLQNCMRFLASAEFTEVGSIVARYCPGARRVLDMPAGNGIATYAFAKIGFEVVAVEPDPSPSVGRGAIDFVVEREALKQIRVVAAFGETLPFERGSFDVVYVRQGLHHALDLPGMVHELGRVLRPGGLMIASREHVVDNYGASLRAFLDSQVDHQLYGGENAFTLADYKGALAGASLEVLHEWGPYDSPINMFPNDADSLRRKTLESIPGRVLRLVLPSDLVARIGVWGLRRLKRPGRLYTFVVRKPEAGH